MVKTIVKWIYGERNLPLKITLSVVCLLCSFWHVGFCPGSPLVCHLVYSFFHANIFHLAINLMVLWSIKNRISVLPAFVIAVLASFLPTWVNEPTMGLSGFLFAVFGIMWGGVGRLKDAAKTVMPFILLTMFFPNINALLHLYCFWLGYIYGLTSKRIR